MNVNSSSIMNDFESIGDAIEYYNSGEDAKANRVLEDLLNFHETTVAMLAEISYILAKNYAKTGNNQKASMNFIKAIRLMPANQEYIDSYKKFLQDKER